MNSKHHMNNNSIYNNYINNTKTESHNKSNSIFQNNSKLYSINNIKPKFIRNLNEIISKCGQFIFNYLSIKEITLLRSINKLFYESINDYYEINLKEKLVLVSGKHEMKFNLDKSWDIFSFSSMLNFMCCSCNQPVKEMSEIVMYNENDINELSNNELSDIKTHKLSYLSRFKDNDSYNDYIIKLDNIIGLDNVPIEQKEEDENANEEEMINSQLKEKEESFTNS